MSTFYSDSELTMTPEVLFKNLENIINSQDSRLHEALNSALKCSFVDQFPQGDERPCDESDFAEAKKYHENHILHLCLIIEKLTNTININETQSDTICSSGTLSLILINCGENVYLKPWNTENTVKNCQLILQMLLTFFKCNSVQQLIKIQNERKIVKEILEIIRPKLLAKTWKHYPATVEMYRWLLEMIVQPELSHHLPLILPTALLLVDDYINENRIIGINCLNHIISNLTLAELQLHGHGDVIYNALIPLIRIRESIMINEVIPCAVAITTKMEADLGHKKLTKWSRFDDIFEIVLESMEYETLIDLRNSYIKNLVVLLKACDIQILRWSKRLLKIFTEYVETAGKYNDDLTISYCLKGIERYIHVTRPAHAVFGKKLVFVLLNILENISNTDSSRENMNTVIHLIKQLDALTEHDKQELKCELEKNSLTSSNLYYFVVNQLNWK